MSLPLITGVISIGFQTAVAQAASTFMVDVATGTDFAGCGSIVSPCKNIQQAVNVAITGDTILVAKGTYTYDTTLDGVCTPITGKTAVVCVLNAELVILGGFSGSDWSTADPVANLTVIDGQNVWRGVRVADTNPGVEPTAGLRLEGFTIRRGRAGTEVGSDSVSRAFGGGFESLFSKVELRDLVVEDNVALGVDTVTGAGGWGLGGGVSIRVPSPGSIIERVHFARNQARGGSGPETGGFGIGGGMLLSDPNQQGGLLTLLNLVFINNVAAGGNSAGDGENGGRRADGQGGGVAFQGGSLADAVGLTATSNTASGGDANGTGGGAFGGGVFLENVINVALFDLNLSNNLAVGGDGTNGGLGEGGGLMSANSQYSLESSTVILNTAFGGGGVGGTKGPPGGGGLKIQRTSGTATVTVRNTVITDNVAQESIDGTTRGGGGGGIFVVGAEVNLIHTTVARNRLTASSNQGLGLVLVTLGPNSSVVSAEYGVIADHIDVPGEVAVHVQTGSEITFVKGLFAGNENDSNQGDINSGTFSGLGTTITAADAGFSSPGAPNYDYHVVGTSPAIDAAAPSTEPIDFEGQSREGIRDLGADELGALPFFSDGFESGDTSKWSNTVGG
ncbi:MAG: hypothetical protein ACC655_00695 [Rhodothermia bacterium]